MMKRGWFVIVLILISSTLIFSSCSRSAEDSLNKDANKLEETTEPSESPSQETPSATPEESKGSSPESTDEIDQSIPTSTADPDENGGIRPIQMAEAGMRPIPISDLNGAAVNPRILQLVDNPWDWQEDYYALGIDQYNYVFVINSNFSEDIAGSSKIGHDFNSIINVLGTPGYKQEDLLVYRTSAFYLAFYGTGKAELAAFIDAPVKDYADDFLYTLIEELNSNAFTSLEASIEKIDPDMHFFHEKGSPDGATYYANSIYGINVSDEIDPVINIMNNYEGNLYIQDTGNIRFSEVFNDLDNMALLLRDTLHLFSDIDKKLETEGVLSPDGKLKAVIYTNNHFIVRTLNGSIQDRHVYQSSTGYFFWLGSRYLLYIDDYSNQPEVVDIDSSMLWGEKLLEMAGLPASGGYKIVSVDQHMITLEDTGSGNILNIEYVFGSNGDISFSAN
ncbi:MAG: hypothetical protein GX625_01475 [Clostridiaceae bacterium]|nr:hypothetical protein [Clostridiaceae bacterium]